MRKTSWLLLLFLLPVHAEEPKPKPRAEPKPIFLWEAKHETGTAYLFGTIHLPDPRVLKLPTVVQEAIDRSDVVLTEIKMDGAAQAKALSLMMLPRGQSLSEILPAEVKERVGKMLPMAAVNQLKIWALTMNLMLLQAGDMFLSGRQPLDLMIPIEAARAGKEIGGLETVEEQIGIFDKLSNEEQIRMLKQTLDMIDKDKAAGKNSLQEMIGLYLEGDLDSIMKLESVAGEEPTEADKKFMKLILDDRNVHMADRLAERMKKNPGKVWFVAVGAAHYAGDVGVGALLKKKGFEVRRMTRADGVPPRVKETKLEPAGVK